MLDICDEGGLYILDEELAEDEDDDHVGSELLRDVLGSMSMTKTMQVETESVNSNSVVQQVTAIIWTIFFQLL